MAWREQLSTDAASLEAGHLLVAHAGRKTHSRIGGVRMATGDEQLRTLPIKGIPAASVPVPWGTPSLSHPADSG